MPETNDYMLGRIDGKLDTVLQALTSQGERLGTLEQRQADIATRVSVLETQSAGSRQWLSYLISGGAFAVAALNYVKGFFA
jgi:hypothetical protein